MVYIFDSVYVSFFSKTVYMCWKDVMWGSIQYPAIKGAIYTCDNK